MIPPTVVPLATQPAYSSTIQYVVVPDLLHWVDRAEANTFEGREGVSKIFYLICIETCGRQTSKKKKIPSYIILRPAVR